eukprot:scaffold16743_cov76-Cyclotella_meneghiniana.AAC.2
MGMMNDDALLRLESNKWKHLHKLTFESLGGGGKVAISSPLFIPKSVSTDTITPKPLQLDLGSSVQ